MEKEETLEGGRENQKDAKETEDMEVYDEGEEENGQEDEQEEASDSVGMMCWRIRRCRRRHQHLKRSLAAHLKP